MCLLDSKHVMDTQGGQSDILKSCGELVAEVGPEFDYLWIPSRLEKSRVSNGSHTEVSEHLFLHRSWSWRTRRDWAGPGEGFPCGTEWACVCNIPPWRP